MLTKTCPPKSTISRSAYWPKSDTDIVEVRGFELGPSVKVLQFNLSGSPNALSIVTTIAFSYRDHVL